MKNIKRYGSAKDEELTHIAKVAIDLWKEKRREITMREIADASGHGVSTIWYYKKSLIEKGLLVNHHGKLYPPGLFEHIGKFFESEEHNARKQT